MTILKVCKIHGELTEKDVHKETNANYKSGIYYRCAVCRREKDRVYKLNNPDKHRASASRSRNEARRLYREGLTEIKPKANIWAENDRKNNPDKHREWSRKHREKEGQLRNTKEVCRRFSLDISDYAEMLIQQNKVCAICKMPEKRKSRRDGRVCALAIDHNHQTGKIRGLLCHSCNVGLGNFEDNIDLLQKAIEYLKKHQCE